MIIVTFFSCLEIEEASNIPEIEFLRYEVLDNIDLLGNQQYEVLLFFSFIDGDGDIGYDRADTTNQKENFFYTLFVKENNEFIDYTIEDTIDYIIPYIEPQKSVRVVKGEIKASFELKKAIFPYDTVKFDVYITDRAKNESNIETTSEIILTE